MVAQYVVVAPKVENINFGWLSSGKLVAPKEDNIHKLQFSHFAQKTTTKRLMICFNKCNSFIERLRIIFFGQQHIAF